MPFRKSFEYIFGKEDMKASVLIANFNGEKFMTNVFNPQNQSFQILKLYFLMIVQLIVH